MATTIGRVEFVVGFDGKKMRKEADAIGDELGKAGDKAGKKFGDEFADGYDKSTSKMGTDAAKKLGDSGKLAGKSWSEEFDGIAQKNFRKMQSNLANTLNDGDLFADMLRGSDDFEKSIRGMHADLDRLGEEMISVKDANGDWTEQLVISAEEADRARNSIDGMAKQYIPLVEAERKAAAQTEDLNASYARFTRTISDKDVFRKLADDLGGVDKAFEKNKAKIEQSSAALGKSRLETERYVDALEKTRDSVEKTILAEEKAALSRNKTTTAASKASNSIKKMSKDVDRGSASMGILDKISDATMGKLHNAWAGMDRTVRLVMTLILSAGDQIAVLGSAVGAGLFAVGGAAVAAIAGVGALIPIFKSLSGDLKDLPDNMQGVAKEFRGLKVAFGDLGGTISAAAFPQLVGAFDDIKGTVKGLTPALALMGETVGKLGKKFANAIKPGTKGFEDLNDLLFQSVPHFESLAESAGTLLGSLVVGFGKANPLTEQFVGWIKRLVTQFDEFVRSDDFNNWVAEASATWTAFGGVLDAVGRSLNNLSNPEAAKRTRETLDDLARFVPTLEKIMEIFGNVNLIGLLAKALAEVGEALTPLLDALVLLSAALGEALMPIVESMAKALGVMATAITPVVVGMADFIDNLPPAVLEAIGVALAGIAVAVIGMKAWSGITGIVDSLATSLGKVAKQAGGMGKLAGIVGKAGFWGVLIAGAFAAGDALEDLYRNFRDFDGIASGAVENGATIESVWNSLGDSVFASATGVKRGLTDIDGALANQKNVGTGFMDTWGNIVATFSDVGQQSSQLAKVMGELDKPLASLAENNLPAAQKQFMAYAKELGITEDQYGQLLETTPEYAKVLEEMAKKQDGVATETDILNMAIGKLSPAQQKAEDATREHAEALAELQGKAVDTSGAIDDLASAISDFGSAQFDTRAATRDLNDAMRDFTDDLAENGASWDAAAGDFDTLTEAGSRQQGMLDDVAQSTLDSAAATLIQTGNLQSANDEYNRGRDALIAMLDPLMGGTEAAEAYVNQLGLTPEGLTTLIQTPGMEQALTDAGLYVDELGNIVPIVSTTVEVPGGQEAISTAHDLDSAFAVLPGVVPTEIDVTGVAPALANVTTVDEATGKLEKTTTTNVAMTGADGVVAAAGKIEGAVGAIPDKDVVALSETGSGAVVAGAGKVEAAVKKIPDTDKVALSETGGDKVVGSADAVKKAIEKIPQTWSTSIKLTGVDNAVSGAGDVEYAISRIKSKTVTITTNYVSNGAPAASGRIINSPQRLLVGEAGPEAIVPLNRALSRVDPSVRWLSALGQGKVPTQPMASGGVVGSGRTVNIEAGAIQVNGGPDPRRTAQEVVNRISERAVG